MRELAKKRLSANFKQSTKYLALVFNDFFVLALIFIFGAVMFWYAKIMKVLPAGKWYYPLILAGILWIASLPGKLVTLFQEADRQFLFTQDDAVQDYLDEMRGYSRLLPAILIGITAAILYPFASLKVGLNGSNYLFLVLALYWGKMAEQQVVSQEFTFDHRVKRASWLIRGLNLAMLLAALYLIPQIAGIVILIPVAASFFLKKRGEKRQGQVFDWQYAIDYETERKDLVYAAFSLFTDVREKRVNIRRRKYLDFLLPSLKKETANSFLFRRSLLRNPEYLNLLARMTAFIVLISLMIADWTWTVPIAFLILYLTVWQLLPLAKNYDRNIMYRVYPIDQAKKGQDLSRVLSWALFLQAIVVAAVWLIALPKEKILSVGLLLLWTLLLAKAYLPYKTKEVEKRARYGKKSGRRK